MATSAETIVLPAALTTALGYMQRPIACPEEIRTRIAGLRVVSDDAPPGGAGRDGMTTNWRRGGATGGGFASRSGGDSYRSGGDSYRSGGYRSGGGGHHSEGYRGYRSGGDRSYRSGGDSYRSGGDSYRSGGDSYRSGGDSYRSGGGSRTEETSRSTPPFSFRGRGRGRGRGGHFSTAPRFGNRARSDATVEERMMDRIRDKMNKFCESTYDSTKAWLTELMDSGATDFLTGFITLVFDKAAQESHICVQYARLITDLRTAFPHLDTELRRIFSEFLTVFETAAVEPDAGSADYDAYVALRKRRQARKGYAAFVAEIARLGVLTPVDVFATCHHILTGLEASKRNPDGQGLTEEYADCLKCLVIGCKDSLSSHTAEMYRLNARVGEAKDRTDSPGLTSRARFALMDVEETCLT